MKKLLFVCRENACRSQKAEAFARLYGREGLLAASASFILNVLSILVIW